MTTEDPYFFILRDIYNMVKTIQESQVELNKSVSGSMVRIEILEENRKSDAARIKDNSDSIIKLEQRFGPVAAGLLIFFSAGLSMVLSMVKDSFGGS